MTDRELLALMASNVWVGVDETGSTLTREAIALDVAISILARVNALEKESKKFQFEKSE